VGVLANVAKNREKEKRNGEGCDSLTFTLAVDGLTLAVVVDASSGSLAPRETHSPDMPFVRARKRSSWSSYI
jgi:hypothetical protein